MLRCDENQATQEKFLSARKYLRDYLLEPYRRQAHITLFVCGFLVEKSQYNDDFPQTQLDTQLQVFEESKLKSFEIEIGGINSFTSAPFLEVHDPEDGIHQIRELLSLGGREFRTAPYRPHLTLGLYADEFPSKELLSRMETFSSKPIRLNVEKVTLATYKADEYAGELIFEYDFCLKI